MKIATPKCRAGCAPGSHAIEGLQVRCGKCAITSRKKYLSGRNQLVQKTINAP